MDSSKLFADNPDEKGWTVDIDALPTKRICADAGNIIDLSAFKINSIDDLKRLEHQLACYSGLRGYDILFRGHSDETYKLIPSIVRNSQLAYSFEKDILKEVKKYGKSKGWEKYRLPSFNEDLFYMGIARHLGLNCRLLDWTSGFWTALSFVLEGDCNKNGDLWILKAKRGSARIANISPFDSGIQNGVTILKEDYYIPDDKDNFILGILRRFRQNGCFTVVPECEFSRPLDEIQPILRPGIELIRIQITSQIKKELKRCKEIKDIGNWLYVNDSYQDIDTIQALNRETKNKHDQIMKKYGTYTCKQIDDFKTKFNSTEKLYHFTSFENAVNILTEGRLRYSELKNANDINESYRQLFIDVSNVADDKLASSFNELPHIAKAISRFRQISFSVDKDEMPGFALSPMWAHYAQKGCGVCIVLEKKEIEKRLKRNVYGKIVEYTDAYDSSITVPNEQVGVCSTYMMENRDEFFFKKKSGWSYEQEYRIIKQCRGTKKQFLDISTAVLAVILCNIPDSTLLPVHKSAIYKLLDSDTHILQWDTVALSCEGRAIWSKNENSI